MVVMVIAVVVESSLWLCLWLLPVIVVEVSVLLLLIMKVTEVSLPFGQLEVLSYMYPNCLADNLLNLAICFNLILLCRNSLTLCISELHFCRTSLS